MEIKTHTATQARPTISLRTSEFRRVCRNAGMNSDADIAERFRVTRTTVWRITSGRQSATADFIAAALAILRRSKFDDLFELKASS